MENLSTYLQAINWITNVADGFLEQNVDLKLHLEDFFLGQALALILLAYTCEFHNSRVCQALFAINFPGTSTPGCGYVICMPGVDIIKKECPCLGVDIHAWGWMSMPSHAL